MNSQPTRRSGLFLLELLIAILFFILSATVCVRFFVKSHTLEQESIDLNHAVTAASSVAEIVRSQEEPLEALGELFPEGNRGENTYSIFYDSNWTLCRFADGVYTVQLETTSSDGFVTGEIKVTKEANTLYQLTVKNYLEKEAF